MRREIRMMKGEIGQQNPLYLKQGIKNLWVFRELLEDVMSCTLWGSLATTFEIFVRVLRSDPDWEFSYSMVEQLLVNYIRYSGKRTLESLRRSPGFEKSYQL